MEHFAEYENCHLCPRDCGVNRYSKRGFCGQDANLNIDSFLVHHGEEPPISFDKGSGTIFFMGCNLRCPYCQNMQISQDSKRSRIYTTKEFIDAVYKLIEQGVENINFVTPDHYLPHIIEAVKDIRHNGINIPTVYNCSGYDTVSNLQKASEYIDIFLFDYKYAADEAASYMNVPDYPMVVSKGLDFLMKNVGNLQLDESGKAVKGTLVRHLVLPTFVDNSIEVINNIYFDYGNRIYLSVMSQYDPAYLLPNHDRLARKVSREEYQTVVDLTMDLGFENVFIQDFAEGDDAYTPDFDKKDNFGRF